MKVVKWIHPNELSEQISQESLYGLDCFKNKYTEVDYNENYEDAIIKELIDNRYIICGDTYQYKCIPIFENDTFITLSMRKWGEIMAEAMNLKENVDKYTYKDFYLASLYNGIEYTPFDIKPSI